MAKKERIDGPAVFNGRDVAEVAQREAEVARTGNCGNPACGQSFPLDEGAVVTVYGRIMGALCPRCVFDGCGLKVGRDGQSVRVVYTRPTDRLIIPAREVPHGLRPVSERKQERGG